MDFLPKSNIYPFQRRYPYTIQHERWQSHLARAKKYPLVVEYRAKYREIKKVKNSTAVALETQNKEALHAVEAEIIEIQQKVIELHKAKQQLQVSESEYAAEVKKYKERMTELEARQTELSESQNRFTEISVWLRTFTEQTDNFDEEGVADPIVIKTLVDHIVMNSDNMEIYFNCGARIVQKYEK